MADRKRKWDEPGVEEIDAKIPKTESAAEAEAAKDAAAEIAARIAAQYGVAGGGEVKLGTGAREANDPDFVHDIEINDLRNRYVLTKGATHADIFNETGANVVTKGTWYPDKSMHSERDPPLYLHITADTRDKLQAAVTMVQSLIDQDLGPLTDRKDQRRKWPEEKLDIGLEPLRNFNVRAKVVGPAGLFVKYIQHETQTRVQIKGIGSQFIEVDTKEESQEPMHIHITGPDQAMVTKAAELAEDLLIVVREEWNKARSVFDQGMTYNSYPSTGYAQGYDGSMGSAIPALPSTGEIPFPPPDFSVPPPQQEGGTVSKEEWQAWWDSMDHPSKVYYYKAYVPGYANLQ